MLNNKEKFMNIKLNKINFIFLGLISLVNPLKAIEFINIGTGSVSGVYYPAGGAICRFLNANEPNLKCKVESTGGSVYNINTMRKNQLEFAIAQSDQQYFAYQGFKPYEKYNEYKDLQAVFSFHAEAFTIVARKDANIVNFEDLKNKRVNIGNPGSGQRSAMEKMMQIHKWKESDFKLISDLKPSEQAKALCDNKIDAFVYVVGYPSASIEESATSCDVNLVNANTPEIKKFVNENPYYINLDIPAHTYKNQNNDINTFGLRATLVTSTRVSDSTVYALTKSVFENLNRIRKMHPSFAHLKPQEMIESAITIPLHPGAIKYYKEAGLIK